MLLKKIIPYSIWKRLHAIYYYELPFLRAKILRWFGMPLLFRDTAGSTFECRNSHLLKYFLKQGSVLNERLTLNYILSVLHPGDIVVDVGANIGGISIPSGVHVSPQGYVYALEPESSNFELLNKNIVHNRLSGIVHTFNQAVYSENGTIALNIFDVDVAPEWHSIGWFEIAGQKPQSSREVQTTTLDTFCEDHSISHIDVLKIDVEGAEPDVLAGATNILQRQIASRIIFEISQIPMKGMGYSVEDTVNPLLAAGYNIYHIKDEGLVPVTLNQINGIVFGNLVALAPGQPMKKLD